MPTILSKMRGYSIGASDRRNMCCTDGIGMITAARVPDGRDMVDIDAEAERPCHAAARLPGLTAGIAASSGGTASAS